MRLDEGRKWVGREVAPLWLLIRRAWKGFWFAVVLLGAAVFAGGAIGLLVNGFLHGWRWGISR